MPLSRSFYASCALCLLACSGKPAEPAPVPAAPAAPAANAPTAVPAAPPVAPATPAAAPAGPDEEACARAIVVAFKGADPPTEGVTRDKAAAEARARELLAKVQAGAELGALAHSDSDAPASAARDGYFATFKRAEWPAMHAAIRDAVYTLTVGQTAPNVVAAPYGYAVVQRCAVEKAHSRHILIRYKGAKRADKSITRSKAEAEAKAKEILKQLAAGADFATVAGNVSEDSSRDRGGDIGSQPRGNLAPAFEKALFALKPGERSGVVETEMGFHIIERVPD
jgi:hypothetical protein